MSALYTLSDCYALCVVVVVRWGSGWCYCARWDRARRGRILSAPPHPLHRPDVVVSIYADVRMTRPRINGSREDNTSILQAMLVVSERSNPDGSNLLTLRCKATDIPRDCSWRGDSIRSCKCFAAAPAPCCGKRWRARMRMLYAVSVVCRCASTINPPLPHLFISFLLPFLEQQMWTL